MLNEKDIQIPQRNTVLDRIEKRYLPAAKIGRLRKFKVSKINSRIKCKIAADK